MAEEETCVGTSGNRTLSARIIPLLSFAFFLGQPISYYRVW